MAAGTTTTAPLVALLGAGLLLAACGDGPTFSGIRDVRPRTVQAGDRILIEIDPAVSKVAVGADTRAILRGADSDDKLVLAARAVDSRRVFVDIDERAAAIIDGHRAFRATAAVEQRVGDDYAPVANSGPRTFRMDFFPATVRSLANDLVGDRDTEEFFEWLGMEVELPESESDRGLDVVFVQVGFEGNPFIGRYDCGSWTDKGCRGGPDGRVHFDEAKQRGFTDVETLKWVDADGSGFITRYEAERAEAVPSPAATAGISVGDRLVEIDGNPVDTATAVRLAWNAGESPVVQVGLERKGEKRTVQAPRSGQPASIPSGFLLAGIMVAVGLLVIAPVPLLGGLIVVWERKISGYIQSRPGPNRVGPRGWLQWLADGVKLIVKEDLIPTEADPVLFRMSPFLVFTGVFATFVVLPFSPLVQVADLNIGVLYILSVTSIVVVGVIMGGWASNSKWSLLGGMRSAAQIISYELPASVAVLAIVVTVGSLSTQDLVRAQGGAPWEWAMFSNPFAYVCFFIFFISALAEGNRTPFDLPEAESELVAGYNTEYSGFRFSIFALAEWVNLVVMGAIISTVFLGGWNIPFVDAADIEGNLLWQVLSFAVFAAKVVFLIFVCIWIRWTLPRFRVDHMMTMCWKYFLPIALVSLMGAAAWSWLIPAMAQTIVSYALFAVGGVLVAVQFFRRVNYARKTTEVWDLRGA